jgi:DUF3047 family protein
MMEARRRLTTAAITGLALLGSAVLGTAAGRPELVFGFTPGTEPDGAPPGWEPVSFKRVERRTRYTVLREGAGHVLRAESQAAAAGLYHPLDLDPREYCLVSWRWKVDGVVERADARRKEGDDYAARVYIAFRYDPRSAGVWEKATYGALRLFYGQYPPGRAIGYVWDNRLAPGTALPSPYTERTRMLVLESGTARVGRWVEEERDLCADYRRLFTGEPPRIAGVGVMTDTDDTGGRAVAYYDSIRLRAAE